MARFCTQITVFFCDMYYVVWDQIFRQIYPVKKGNAKECSDYCTIALISHASKVMVKILQARLQQYVNHGFDYAKAFDYVDHNKLWKILKEMGISDHLTCLLRNLYEGQKATVRTGHGTTDWF